MRVLLTGASGFLGRRLGAALVARGDQVVGACVERQGIPAGVDFQHLDVRDRARVGAVVAAADPEVVFHLAALSHVGESWRRIPDYFSINLVGTEHVVAAARGRRLVFASSAEVYGVVPEPEQPIAESREPAPRSPYALTKAASERLVLAAGGVVARCFNLVGAGQAQAFALPSFAAQLAAIGAGRAAPVLRVGNLGARRDFVHVDDGAEGLMRLGERGAPGEVYNLAGGRAFSIAEMLDRLIAIAGLAVTLEQDPERLRPIDVPLLAGDAGRLRGLGWSPRRGVDPALAELWAAARAEVAAGTPA